MKSKNREPGPAETIARYETRVERDLLTARDIFDYADALRQVGRKRDALAMYDRLNERSIPPGNRWQVSIFKGVALQDKGLFPDAERCFREACEFNSGTPPRIYLAGALAAQEKFVDAIDVLQDAVNLPGDRDEVHLNLALNQRTVGLLEEAITSARTALSISPNYDEAKELLDDLIAAKAIREGLNK